MSMQLVPPAALGYNAAMTEEEYVMELVRDLYTTFRWARGRLRIVRVTRKGNRFIFYTERGDGKRNRGRGDR